MKFLRNLWWKKKETDFCYIETAAGLQKTKAPECQTEYAFGKKISSLERGHVKNKTKKITHFKKPLILILLSVLLLFFFFFFNSE